MGSRLAIALQAADLAEKCFLSEILFWVAMDRLPLALYGMDGDEFRFSREMELCVQSEIEQEVTESECQWAGLPLSPRIIARNEDKHLSPVEFYDQILKADFYSDDQRLIYEDERKQAIEAANLYAKWNSKYLEFLEYHKARIFVDIRDRKINGKGIKIRGSNIETIRETLDSENISLSKLPMEEIPFGQWTFSGIDWDNCILYCDDISYCWINFDVEAMLSTYPIQDRPSAGLIIQVGDLFVLQQTGAEARRCFKWVERPVLRLR